MRNIYIYSRKFFSLLQNSATLLSAMTLETATLWVRCQRNTEAGVRLMESSLLRTSITSTSSLGKHPTPANQAHPPLVSCVLKPLYYFLPPLSPTLSPLSPLSSPLSPTLSPFFPTIPHSLPFFPTIPHSLPFLPHYPHLSPPFFLSKPLKYSYCHSSLVL